MIIMSDVKKFNPLKIIIPFMVLILLGCGGYGGYSFYTYYNHIDKLFEERTYELSENNDNFNINVEDCIASRNQKIIDAAVLDTEDVDLTKVGTYEITCTAQKEVFTYSINVVDTTAPIIFKAVHEKYGTGSVYTYTIDDFAATCDLSEIKDFEIISCIDSEGDEISVNAGNINFTAAGDYRIEVQSVDEYGNTAQETFTISVLESPHFILISDKKIKTGDTFDFNKLVYSYDAAGDDITSSVVINDSGYDCNTIGSYTIEYSVTDQNGMTAIAAINVEVGDFEESDYGITYDDLKTLIDHDYFTYETLDTPDSDAAVELTAPASVSIKCTNGVDSTINASGFIYKITEDACYFVTNKHCVCILKGKIKHTYIYNGQRFLFEQPEIYYGTKGEDLVIYKISTDQIPLNILLKLKQINIDWDIYDEIKAGDIIFANTQEHGRPNYDGSISTFKDYHKKAKIISLQETNEKMIRYFGKELITSTRTLFAGQSGSPVLNEYGKLVGIACGVWPGSTDDAAHDGEVKITYIEDIVEANNLP